MYIELRWFSLISIEEPNIRNMGLFMIVQARGFGTAKIPILEVKWV